MLALCAVSVLLAWLQSDLGSDMGPRSRSVRAVIDVRYANFGDAAPMLAASHRLAQDRRALLYESFQQRGASFIYPPSAAIIAMPIATANDPLRTLFRVNQCFFVAIVVIAAWLARPAGRLASAVMVVAAVAFHPLARAVELNQASVFLTFVLGLVFVALAHQRQSVAGIALAFAIAVKPHLILMLPVMWWHARQCVFATLGAGAVLLVGSLAYAGFENHASYIADVLPMLSDGYAFYPNQSWNGFLHRLIGHDALLFAVATPSTAVRLVSIGIGVAIVAAACVTARRLRHTHSVMHVVVFSWLAATLAAPLAWEHHYAPALFAFAVLIRFRAATQRYDLLAASSWILIANYFEVRTLETARALLSSYVLWGGVLLAVSVYFSMKMSKSSIRTAGT